jgi:hypothetical protein
MMRAMKKTKDGVGMLSRIAAALDQRVEISFVPFPKLEPA